MFRLVLLSAVTLLALASCKSVRTVYDENGKVVTETDGARQRSLNDYFTDEFDSRFSEKKNKDGVPEAASAKVSRYQKDIDAARRNDKTYTTDTYNPGGASSYAGKAYAAGRSDVKDKRYSGTHGSSAFSRDMRPDFMNEGRGISRTDNPYQGPHFDSRYGGEGATNNARDSRYTTSRSSVSTSDSNNYVEGRRNKYGKPRIIGKDDYYRRTIEDTRTMLGRDK
ncbi:MAG: hypothetical protein IJA63_10275 [Akkermansia sp.]|nr:hypothetical protein [Akkermansia sp.]